MTKIHEILMKHAFEPDKTLQALQAFMKADPVNFARMTNIVDDNRLSPLGLIFYYSAACTASYDEVILFLRMSGAKISPDSIEAKMIQHIKNNGSRDMSTLGKMINDKPTEALMLSERPRYINVCDVLPAEGGMPKAVELAEFERQYKTMWCRSIMLCKAYIDYTHEITQSFFLPQLSKSIVSQLRKPSSDFAIVNMGENYGYGTFAIKDIPGNTINLYGGEVKTKEEFLKLQSAYAIDITPDKSQNILVDGSKYRNYVTFMQHLPEDVSDLKFVYPELAQIVALANVEIKLLELGSTSIPFVLTLHKISANEIIGYDYGRAFWCARGKTPSLFDKQGRLIPPALYTNDVIECSFPEYEGYFIRLPREKLLDHLQRNEKFYVNANFDDGPLKHFSKTLTPPEILKLLDQHDFVPHPKFKKPEALDLAYELRQAAADGNFAVVEYLLDWYLILDHQTRQLRSQRNLQAIDVNAVKDDPASLQRTALHHAAEKGHLYLTYYLVLKGALLKNDRKGINAIDLAKQNGRLEIEQFLRRSFKLHDLAKDAPGQSEAATFKA